MISRFKRSAASTTTVLRRAALEALESRQLLTVSVDGGILFVTGTSGNDTITILRDPVVKGMLRVSVNGFYNAVDQGAITQIRVDALAGDDRITVDQSNGVISTPLNAAGGDGNDSITGG